MRKFLSVLVLLASYFPLHAQHEVYLGAEVHATDDIFHFQGSGPLMSTVIPGSAWGFTAGYSISSRLLLETGFIHKYYNDGYGFHGIDGAGSGTALDAFQIPIRVRGSLPLSRKLSATATLGLHFCINTDYVYDHGTTDSSSGFSSSGTNSETDESTENTGISQYFSLFETSVGLNIKLFKTLLWNIGISRYSGFQKIETLDIHYTYNQASYHATGYSKGSYWSLNTGLRFPISIIWQKNKGERQ